MALVSDPSLDAPVFHLPYGMRYDCLRDGVCCRDWDIPLSGDDVSRLREADWAQAATEAGGDGPTVRNRQGQDLIRRVGGACNFLGPTNLCRLHELLGISAKPHGCRQFPFRFVEAPDGVYVGLSFVCTSVARNIGVPVEDQYDPIRETHMLRPGAHKLASPVRFDSATPITWEDYLAIEAVLDRILSREEHSLETCLIAGHAWLGILRRMLHEGRMPPGLTASEIIRYYIGRAQSGELERCFEIARRSVANPALKRMLLGSFISFRTSLTEGRTRAGVTARILLENARHWLRVGAVRLPELGGAAISHRSLEARKGCLAGPDAQEMLRRYFRHALFRKDLICHTDLFWGYCFLVLAYGLVQWHGAALRALPKPDDDPARALGMVERGYVHHSSFNQLFLYHPALAEVFQYIFKKPNFAHSIING